MLRKKFGVFVVQQRHVEAPQIVPLTMESQNSHHTFFFCMLFLLAAGIIDEKGTSVVLTCR